MKLIFSLLFGLSLLLPPCAAQETCQLELKDAPALLNLKLGATPVETQTILGKDLKIKNKRSGEYTFFENFIEKRPPASVPNVRAVYLRFFDGRLYQIEIFYDDETAPLSLEDFVSRQSAALNLPADAWEIKRGIARLRCSGFSLVADRFLNSRLELTDEKIRAAVKAKREKKS